MVTFLNSVDRFFLAGPITLTGNNQITADSNAFGATAFSGVVTGSGSLNLLGGALAMQDPNNTYSGGTNLGGGNLLVTSSDTGTSGNVTAGPLGTGAINLTGGLFQAAATNVPDLTANAITLHNTINLINANTIITGPASTTTAGAQWATSLWLARSTFSAITPWTSFRPASTSPCPETSAAREP